MNHRLGFQYLKGAHKIGRALTIILVLLSMLGVRGPQSIQPVQAQAATTDMITLRVVSARTEPDHPGGAVLAGDVIPAYQFIINVDNTGDPTQPRELGCDPSNIDPNNPDPAFEYPNSCDWPSLRAVPGASPIFTQGDETVLNDLTGLTLEPGKYLISIVAEGYKIGGAHFSIPMEAPGLVTVELQPHPLPPATMRIKVFEDKSPVNGQFDAPAEAGLAGFRVVINDILGQVSVDVFGNPLCTTYDAAGEPNGITDCLISDANGDIAVPNLGPNRFDVLVIPPDGEPWIETTTLEGSPSWDTWLQEGGTGLDNEFVVAGEPFPWTMFGYTRPMNLLNDGAVTGGITGRIVGAAVYIPQAGGLPYYGGEWNGLNGARVTGPITDAWVALSDFQNGDTAVYVGQADAEGLFAINNVPDGNYLLTYWDTNLHYILDWIQVTVSDGLVTDIGTPFLTGWFTKVEGTVFNDLNGNGSREDGEPGIADYLVVLKDRDNTEIDRMSISAVTDPNGYYVFEKAYPMGSWMILEAYNDRYFTTGVTYQVENQPAETTVLGAGVDVGFLPMLGQAGRLDWGVQPYAPGTNGGIVGTVFYDTTRNELDARYQAVEGWAPGIPGLRVNVWESLRNPDGSFVVDPATGAYAKGKLLNSALTETWEQPVDCQAYDVNGAPLVHGYLGGVLQNVLAPASGGYRCLEGPIMGTQFQSGFATLDGNYGFGTIWTGGLDTATFEPLPEDPLTGLPNEEVAMGAGDYLVEVVIPTDSFGRPGYQVVKEEDINVFGGDQFTPQIPPPACVGAMHTVDVAGIGADGPGAVVNPSFLDAGGSPFEGMQRPLCDVKLVTVSNGRSIAPTFNLFTNVPIPGKWKGYIINDLALSISSQDLFFGEKAGMANAPIGIYDFTGKLVTTIQSDPNGTFEVLLPSTYSINCPTPSGVCPNVYYMLGNDPGQPGRLNANYNPQFRTIGASFEIYPGVLIPSDLAPTQIVTGVLPPGSAQVAPPECRLDAGTPEIFAVSRPYVNTSGSFTIQGQGFGAQGLNSRVMLDNLALTVTAWTDTSITVNVLAGTPRGPHQLSVRADNGLTTVNGLTFHVRGAGYNPDLYEVGPGYPYATIQSAINQAATQPTRSALVVVYPGQPAQWNPDGAYFENIIMQAPVKLQGVGPGGSLARGTVIDGVGVLGDATAAVDWRNFVENLPFDGNQIVYEGAVISVFAQAGEFGATFKPSIDGFTIRGGDQQGFPNVQPVVDPTVRSIGSIQGGGIYVNGYAANLQITNNVLRSNGGAYGGAIRIGTPHLPGAANDNHNDALRIANNRILANGGTNLAGGIAIFSGADDYEVAGNDICGNFSGEYGGGISHYGYSPNGKIHHNRIYFNRSYDEGGGIMIAGELPADPATLSPGAGPVDIYANLIQDNLANDDGGGVRFLMAGNFPMNVYNNFIVNNVSTHEGGGISLNDTPDARVINNTIMKNITTATAITSNGQPAPAGLASARNSTTLQATLPEGAPIFSNPLLFNNIFWDNRAGTWTGGGVSGIGSAGDPNPINAWDMGVSDGAGVLAPTNSLMETDLGTIPDGTNVYGQDPVVQSVYDSGVSFLAWRGNPRFVDPLIVAESVPVELMGNYRLGEGSPAENIGATSRDGIAAPLYDIDGDARHSSGGYEAGADEIPSLQPAFPTRGILDNFNRANGAVGPNWAGLPSPTSGAFRIFANHAEVFNPGSMWWTPSSFGANQEAYLTFTQIRAGAPEQGLMLKFNGASPSDPAASMILATLNPTTGQVSVMTNDPSQGTITRAAFPVIPNAGQQMIGARVLEDGAVFIYQGNNLLGSINVNAGLEPWPAELSAGGGRIGVWFTGVYSLLNPAKFDNFGGGTMP